MLVDGAGSCVLLSRPRLASSEEFSSVVNAYTAEASALAESEVPVDWTVTCSNGSASTPLKCLKKNVNYQLNDYVCIRITCTEYKIYQGKYDDNNILCIHKRVLSFLTF